MFDFILILIRKSLLFTNTCYFLRDTITNILQLRTMRRSFMIFREGHIRNLVHISIHDDHNIIRMSSFCSQVIVVFALYEGVHDIDGRSTIRA